MVESYRKNDRTIEWVSKIKGCPVQHIMLGKTRRILGLEAPGTGWYGQGS